MPRTMRAGRQDLEKMRIRNDFYVDKTHFIREWRETDDDVTSIIQDFYNTYAFLRISCASQGKKVLLVS